MLKTEPRSGRLAFLRQASQDESKSICYAVFTITITYAIVPRDIVFNLFYINYMGQITHIFFRLNVFIIISLFFIRYIFK